MVVVDIIIQDQHNKVIQEVKVQVMAQAVVAVPGL
jgi:hypothetical protein